MNEFEEEISSMGRWQRALYTPVKPLGEGGRIVTGSPEHIELSRRAAGEGMVLVKNEGGVLPLKRGEKIALFGKGTIDYVKGGGGSGEVYCAYRRNLAQGLAVKEKEGKVLVYPETVRFYEENVRKQFEEGAEPGLTVEPAVPEELLAGAAAFADTAVISICRFSGEGWDRKTFIRDTGYEMEAMEQRFAHISSELFENGDFELTNAEKAMVEAVRSRFQKVVVVLNAGGMISTGWFADDPAIQGALLAFQGGMEGGLAMADILTGDVNPSGRLTDTYARTLEDYPSTDSFHESVYYVNYKEDIYVGYRYFETIPGASEKVIYPFGYGLSYTDFLMETREVCEKDGRIVIRVLVTNTGNRDGKEVVEVYYSAPQGLLGKPAKELAAFAKTRLLKPGESQTMVLSFPISDMASYDDLGKCRKSAYVLEPGEYSFYVGKNVRDAVMADFTYSVEELRIVEQLSAKAVPHDLKERMLADGSFETLPTDDKAGNQSLIGRQDFTGESGDGRIPGQPAIPTRTFFETRKEKERRPQFSDVAEGKASLDDFVSMLSDEELIRLTGGQPNTGVANTWGFGNVPDAGIPNFMTEDGPAGVRINPECGVATTAFPCATLLASTWDTDLAEEIGRAGGKELKENNIYVWLTPAVNIHRSPLCGRNFEYYSEDPVIAGKMGAAMVRGIQSNHVGASVKHFCCNDKETNRRNSDSRVSERALREIYLKQFEIIIKESDPYTVMSSYNIVNGTRASENWDTLTGILREEWGFKGFVTTDWWTLGEHYLEEKAGNDLKMANGYPERLKMAMEAGALTREDLIVNVKRILSVMLRFE